MYGVDVDANITRFKIRLEGSMSDDLEVIKSGKILYAGWTSKIKEAAVSVLSNKRAPEKMSEVAETLRDDTRNFDKKIQN